MTRDIVMEFMSDVSLSRLSLCYSQPTSRTPYIIIIIIIIMESLTLQHMRKSRHIRTQLQKSIGEAGVVCGDLAAYPKSRLAWREMPNA